VSIDYLVAVLSTFFTLYLLVIHSMVARFSRNKNTFDKVGHYLSRVNLEEILSYDSELDDHHHTAIG